MAVDDTLAVRGFKQRGQKADGRALARAVGSDEAEHFAGLDFQVQILDGRQLAILFGELDEFDHVRAIQGAARSTVAEKSPPSRFYFGSGTESISAAGGFASGPLDRKFKSGRAGKLLAYCKWPTTRQARRDSGDVGFDPHATESSIAPADESHLPWVERLEILGAVEQPPQAQLARDLLLAC